jgi:hypothetical protein
MHCRVFPAGPPHRTMIRGDGPVPCEWRFGKEVFILPILLGGEVMKVFRA